MGVEKPTQKGPKKTLRCGKAGHFILDPEFSFFPVCAHRTEGTGSVGSHWPDALCGNRDVLYINVLQDGIYVIRWHWITDCRICWACPGGLWMDDNRPTVGMQGSHSKKRGNVHAAMETCP